MDLMSLLDKIAPVPRKAARQFLRFLSSSDIDPRMQAPSDSRVRFALIYKNYVIGMLSHEDGRWIFRYAEGFRKLPSVKPLMMFPDPEKVYESDELWPFFQMRIPGLKQPAV